MTTEQNEAWIKDAAILKSLRDAQPTTDDITRDPGGTEERRIDAVRHLRELYRHPPVDHRVREFFDQEWCRVLLAPDPAAAASELFNGKPQVGHPPHSDERNLKIAVAVQKLRDAGMTVEQACGEARQRHAPEIVSWERIREIYYGPAGDQEARERWRRAIQAEIALSTEIATNAPERDKVSDQ